MQFLGKFKLNLLESGCDDFWNEICNLDNGFRLDVILRTPQILYYLCYTSGNNR